MDGLDVQAPESRLFSFRSEFHASVLEVLGRCRHTLALRADDFSDWPLETPQAFEQFSRVLGEPGASLRLVVHSPDWLEKYGARFAQLRRNFGGRIECRQAPAAITPGEELLIGDRIHLVRRAHYDSFRGRLLVALPEQVDPWWRKYELLWQESTPCLAGTTAGL
jgi:hypothetical protein